ncbi:MAG TPA: ornithine cyclodeaminase family protein [Nocardioidaceae bacterium]|nr:ornithine cyclodeaminase family protein [Nocardioidaceae bacterium]
MSAPVPALPYVDADSIAGALPWARATDAVEQSLLDGLDPGTAADRTVVDVAHGQLLLMPAETGTAVGVKLGTVAPDNPGRGLPRIQALYVLLDRWTLTPLALLDGTALTTLRTPAVSAVAVRHLAGVDARHLVVFGSGPQAWGHVESLRAVRPVDTVTVVGRDPGRAEELVTRVADSGLHADLGEPACVAEADLVVCATTAAEPVFEASQLKPGACVVAVGSHEPDRRELEASLLARAAAEGGVVVEDLAVAMREAGDVVMAVAEGAIGPEQLTGLASVVRRDPVPGAISVFKSVGMGWQDLVVAQAVVDRLG